MRIIIAKELFLFYICSFSLDRNDCCKTHRKLMLQKIASLGDFYRIMLHEKRWSDKVTRYPPILSHLGSSLLPATDTISAVYFITIYYGRNNIFYTRMIVCVWIRLKFIFSYIANLNIYTFSEKKRGRKSKMFRHKIDKCSFEWLILRKGLCVYFNSIYNHYDVSNALLRETLVINFRDTLPWFMDGPAWYIIAQIWQIIQSTGNHISRCTILE